MDTRTDPPHCILSRFQSLIPVVAKDYPQAQGCHVVDLSKNWCLYADGTDGGCNSMPECDPLTGALHFQYGLPGGPTNTAITALKTGVFNPSPFTNAPDPTLVNPTGGTVFVPATQYQVQSAIDAALGPLKPTTQQIAAATNAPPVNTASVPPTKSLAPGSSNPNPPSSGTGGKLGTSTFDLSAFLQEQSIGSIPNWALIAAGVGLAIYLGTRK